MKKIKSTTKPQKKIDSKKIAKALGAKVIGKVSNKGGFFGAMQTLAEVNALRSRKMSKIFKREIHGCHECPSLQHVYDEQEDIYCTIKYMLIMKCDELGDCHISVLEILESVREKIKEKYNGGFHKDCPLDDKKDDEGFVI